MAGVYADFLWPYIEYYLRTLCNIVMNFEDLLKLSFEVVHQSAHPDNCMRGFIPQEPKDGRLIVIGAGKASAAMAAAFEQAYQGEIEGLVVTRYGHSVPTSRIKIIEAAHPVPDRACVEAVEAIADLLKTSTLNDVIVCLISGGGSSLLTAPIDSLEFDVLQRLNDQLLKSGASIHDMNVVRKHLNKALGGGLASYANGAKMITLAISDVTGDDPSIIASGATVADPSTCSDALAILKEYNIDCDLSVINALQDPGNETSKPDDPVFKDNEYHLIATPKKALEVAAAFWRENGFHPYILDSEMEGDTNVCALQHIELIDKVYSGESDIQLPCALISGGETTVQVTGSGEGGPNTQFMLSAAIELDGHDKVYGLACDTDGIDGSTDNAGAVITPNTIKQMKEQGVSAQQYLDNNDSYHAFSAIEALVKTGPTFTNVNDYRVFLLLP